MRKLVYFIILIIGLSTYLNAFSIKVEVDNLRILGWGKWYGLPNDEIEKQMVIL